VNEHTGRNIPCSNKVLIPVFFILVHSILSGQNNITIYLIPGQGSDCRIFDSLVFDSFYDVRILEYGTPAKGATMQDFAKTLACQIDTSREVILIGHSLGGMLCSELSEILRVKKTIIVSSAKNRHELPFRYRFQQFIPFYKVVPKKMLVKGALMIQPIVEPDRKSNEEVFNSMLSGKDPDYMRRTIEMIIKWNRKSNSGKIYHLHGTDDHTLPLKRVSPDYVVKDGSHMMILTRGKEINNIINIILHEDRD